MNIVLAYVTCGIASYLLGAVPFGYVIARAKRVDIRRMGSGNIGATNVFRTVGKAWGILTFICDVLKGFIAARFIPIMAGKLAVTENVQLLSILCACLAVAGHNWPVYLRFKGGKGVATSAGALLAIAPIPLGIGLVSWLVIFPLTRYVSLASITAAVTMPVSGWILYLRQNTSVPQAMLVPIILTVLGVLAIWRHKTNIQRLIKGTEHRFEFKKKK